MYFNLLIQQFLILQTKTVRVNDPNAPFSAPLPTTIGPVKQVEVEVTVQRNSSPQPNPTSIEIVIKGCIKGKLLFSFFTF